jgi:hypothetical protein
MNGISPKFMRQLICKLIVVKGMKIHDAFERLRRLVEEEKINSEETKSEFP